MPDECVYIIALERPACAPTRVKIGYTRNLQRRLKAFRTTYPNAVVIWTRAGTRKTERDLLAEARRFPQAFPIEKSEVFEFSDLNGFVRDIAENLSHLQNSWGRGSAQSSDSQGEHPIVLDFDCVFWS